MFILVESRPLDDGNDSEEITIGLDGLHIASQADPASNLCTTCHKMTLPKLQSARFHDHKHYRALKPSASHCPMCKMLLTGLEKAWEVEAEEMDKERGSLDEDEDVFEKKVMVSIEVPFPTGYINRRPRIEL